METTATSSVMAAGAAEGIRGVRTVSQRIEGGARKICDMLESRH